MLEALAGPWHKGLLVCGEDLPGFVHSREYKCTGSELVLRAVSFRANLYVHTTFASPAGSNVGQCKAVWFCLRYLFLSGPRLSQCTEAYTCVTWCVDAFPDIVSVTVSTEWCVGFPAILADKLVVGPAVGCRLAGTRTCLCRAITQATHEGSCHVIATWLSL